MDPDKRNPEEFVTVVNIHGGGAPPSSAETFVTVLSIGAGKLATAPPLDANGIVDPAHPEEEVEVYRLPGERLGFGLKFEGGNKTSERVRRLFIQSCAEQSPASRATCSWGHLGEGDEVLLIDGVSVTQMTRLDCVRRLKESQLVIKLKVRYRGALRPEVVSAERKLNGQPEQQKSKVPPELPAAPPPVPPRKLRHSAQAVNRGLADGEACPGSKKSWGSPKSNGSSEAGSPLSQGSYRSATSSIRSSNYDSCTSTPIKNGLVSKTDSPKSSPKSQVSPVINKIKQEPPAEAQWYLDARSQDGSSTHGSTSDDTSSSLSTVVDRFSNCDRFSTTSTISTTSEQLFHQESLTSVDIEVNGDHKGIVDLKNPDFLLTRLANSEARTYVESRGDVERVTAVVAPNTVLIEETPALQPPLSFQDAPLSYGHEPRPGIFYSADLAADSKTHFRPIKDDAEMVEKVVNGDVKVIPLLPTRNHVNRIPINQQETKKDEVDCTIPALPPKPMPRKEVKSKRKRPPPPPPPPRREPPPPIPEARNIEHIKKMKNEIVANENNNENKETETLKDSAEKIKTDLDTNEIGLNNNNEKLAELDTNNEQLIDNKILEIVEMKKATVITPQNDPSRTSEYEVPEAGTNVSVEKKCSNINKFENPKIDVQLKNSINKKILIEMKNTDTLSIEIEENSDEDERICSKIVESDKKTLDADKILDKTEDTEMCDESEENEKTGENFEFSESNKDDEEYNNIQDETEDDSELQFVEIIRREAKTVLDDEDIMDESDGEEYYWQSNLATIGEEEENNSLDYEDINEEPLEEENEEPIESPKIIESITEKPCEALIKNELDEEPERVSRIASDSRTEDKKQDKNVVNGRMDNCGGGGQRLPPDGDEFPAAYQEFTNSFSAQEQQQTYPYVTARDKIVTNSEVADRAGESVVDASSFRANDKTKAAALSILDTKSKNSFLEMDVDKRNTVTNYVLYSSSSSTQKSLDKKIEIAGYYPKDHPKSSEDSSEPPPLPLTGPPKIPPREDIRKQPTPNNDLWRQDNMSEKSVKDKIAMFSSQSNLEAPLFPTSITATSTGTGHTFNGNRKLSKHKSSDDVFADDKRSPVSERTQSTFDLSNNLHYQSSHKKSPSLPQSSPPSSPGDSYNGYGSSPYKTSSEKYNGNGSLYSPMSSYNSISPQSSSPSKSPTNTLIRATSFSGSSSFYGSDSRLQTSSELLQQQQLIARTNSLASTFKRPSDDMRKSSLNQLIEQRRKGISKLRGLVIPEKDAVPIEQPIIDLPEIKSRDSILNNQVPRANIQDKWGSQSSLASNASTVSSSVRNNNTPFKMPAPKILSSYSPAFKRKSLSVFGNNSPPTTNGNNNISNNNNNCNSKNNGSQLGSPASDAPKSLESICSPTRSDYSFEFVSSSLSPDNSSSNNLQVTKPKINCQRKNGRNEYDDSDNDSAVSSSQSSISRGFSPPASPVPSDRSTISSERSYLSSEAHYQRPQLILDNSNKINGNTVVSTDKSIYTAKSNFLSERSFSSPASDKCQLKSNCLQQQQPSSNIPQRQSLKRSVSNETNSSTMTTMCCTASSQSESLSRRVLKPQSVEAINRKNILASARCRSGKELNGSPLIQRKFSDDDEDDDEDDDAVEEDETQVDAKNSTDAFVSGHKVTNGTSTEIKIAYIEIVEDPLPNGDKFCDQKKLDQVPQQPRLPPKRSVIPQARSVPIPTARPPKQPETLEASNDMKSWVRAEMRTLTSSGTANSYEDCSKKLLSCDAEISSSDGPRNFRSNSSQKLNPQTAPTESNLALNKSLSDSNDLLTVLTTKSRSRSAIHVEETNYGSLKSPMSLEDILAGKTDTSSKLPRSQCINSDSKNGVVHTPRQSLGEQQRIIRRSNSTDSWSEEKIFATKIPSVRSVSRQIESLEEANDVEYAKMCNSKIPMARNLGRRSASVTDMKKVFEKVDVLPNGTSSSTGQSVSPAAKHNRFPSLDSSVEESIRPVVGSSAYTAGEPDQERFGSISSLASSTSLISQQELAQLVEEANLEEPRGGHDVVVVLLHKESPSASVGITLAGGVDCETKEISVHRVLSHSVADKEGSVQRGDRILSINGRSMRGLTHRESLAVLKQPRSELVLVLSRAKADENASIKLRSRTESVETIVEGYETNGSVPDNTAWGPAVTVSLYKDGAGLGFSLEGGRDSPLGDRPLLIKKIFTGGAADKTGALRAGDQLLEVNKRDVSRLSRIEAWSLMKKLPDGEVNLLVRHPATKSS